MATPDTTLNLGGIQFNALEIPSNIPWGTSQTLAVHKFPGGDRTIDAMGPDYRAPQWSGLFFGSDAFARASALEAMAAGGEEQTLTFGGKTFRVIVAEFSAEFHRLYEMPYHITCEVIADQSSPVSSNSVPSTDDALNSDLGLAEGYAALLVAQATQVNAQAIAVLQASIGSVATAMAAVTTFVGASPGTVASVLQPLATAQNATTALIGSSDSTIGSFSGFSGMIAGAIPSTLIAAMNTGQSTTQQETTLWNLSGVLGRMSANLNAVNGSPNTVATAGGNLFQIASQQYGDPNDWTAIATANGLTDPFIQGNQVLTIPLAPGDSGGILNS
jgi:hypothetical protein